MDDPDSIEVQTVPTDSLETPDYETTWTDRNRVPLVAGTTVVTEADARTIAARKRKLAHKREKLENSDMLTKRELKKSRKESVERLESSTVVQIPDGLSGEKRSIVTELVEQSETKISGIETVDKRLLTAVLIASRDDQVSHIKMESTFAKFFLTDATLIEAANVGDTIVVQGRGYPLHSGQEVARSFPSTCLTEIQVLDTVNDLLSPAHGWNVD